MDNVLIKEELVAEILKKIDEARAVQGIAKPVGSESTMVSPPVAENPAVVPHTPVGNDPCVVPFTGR